MPPRALNFRCSTCANIRVRPLPYEGRGLGERSVHLTRCATDADATNRCLSRPCHLPSDEYSP